MENKIVGIIFCIMTFSVFTVLSPVETCEAAEGNTLYVGGTETDRYVSIQEAINAANSGDTIFVHNGIYYENIVIDKLVNLIGEDKNSTIIDGSATEDEDYDFTFVWMTDTQHYSEKYPEIYDSMTQWIVDNKENEKIIYCIHTGDIVENWNNVTEWERANHSMNLLDNASIPYGVLAGNHDSYFAENMSSNHMYYNRYFGSWRFQNQDFYGGNFKDNENHYDLISAGGIDFIILYLSYNITDDEFEWANEILNTYNDRYAILSVHALIKVDQYTTDIYNPEGGEFNEPNSGLEIRSKLIEANDNVFLVLCGHFLGAFYESLNHIDGGTVHVILSNFQDEDLGGSGYFQLFQFDVSNDVIHYKTYSPYLKTYDIIFSEENFGKIELDLSHNMKSNVVTVSTNRVNINGFTIQNADGSGILIKSDNNIIQDNILTKNNYGIYVSLEKDGNQIDENKFYENENDIFFESSENEESTSFTDDNTSTSGFELILTVCTIAMVLFWKRKR